MTRLSDISQLRSSFPRTAIALTSPFSLMVLRSFSPFLLISLGLGLFNPLCGLAIPPRNQQTAPATTNRSMTVFYVSSTTGNDGGQGTQQSPFKTITKAVSMAPSNTAIILAPGTYSSQTGEQFPIILHNNVTLQGNPNTKGKDVIITGGGWYSSKTSAQQNITMLGANSSRISGVTITNPNQRGYGLWIESSSLIVSQNTFTGNSHDGISIVGISAPIIQDNSFIQNGANGITIYGNSRPEIRNNEFQNTGFGINIAQNAAPFVIGNRVFDNKDGIVIQANARPILRNNQIERNQRDGIVAIAESLPDLGNTQEPGGNVIRNNGRYDLNNGTKGQEILAYGNQLAANKIIGPIQLSPYQTAMAGTSPLARQLSNPTNTPGSRTGGANDPTTTTPINTASSLPVYLPESNTANPNGIPIPAAPTRPTTPAAGIPIPVPPPESSRLPPLPNGRPPQPAPRPQSSGDRVVGLLVPVVSDLILGRRASVPVPPRTQPRQTPQAITQPPQSQPSSVAAIGILAVPGPDIPIGSGGGLLPNEVASGNLGDIPLSPTALGLRYRVVVESSSDADLRRVRSVVPEAFTTVVQGRSVVQAGAFRDQYRANSLLQQLTRSGLRARIEMMN
jgi:parallel beta-helix repeat protein